MNPAPSGSTGHSESGPAGVARHPLKRWLRRIAEWALAASLGVLVTALAVFIWALEQRPDLGPWHLADLDEEFTTRSEVTNLEGYLALEDRLFEQLDTLVYGETDPAAPTTLNRYQRGSLADPARWSTNWNRTFILPQPSPRAVVLLLHGLSDAPYSLRSLGQAFHGAGAHVVGLRIPGHGTAPSGLIEVRWQDMAAATALALRDLAGQFPDRPLYVVGYSNGAALALNATLDALDDSALPLPDRLVLLAPEVRVSALAAFAVWQGRLGHWLGLEKLAWNDILLEYEPFKYGSFAVNAGDVSHRLTIRVQERLRAVSDNGELGRMPPILAFSSVVDATVEAPALVSELFNPLPGNGHELVLFDINRQAGVEQLLGWTPDAMIAAVEARADRDYSLQLVSNRDAETPEVALFPIGDGPSLGDGQPLGLVWPPNVFSLSHVALPFPRSDSLYGPSPDPPSPGVQLGGNALRGERGALLISESAMLRQRWNPFYDFLEAKALAFLGLEPGGSERGPAASDNPTRAGEPSLR